MSLVERARPLMVARLVSAGLTFAIPLVLARTLETSEYGTFKQAWLVVSTLYLVLQLGLPMSLYYFMPREPLRRFDYLANTVFLLTMLGALAGLGIAFATPVLARYFDNPALGPLAPWLGFLTFALIAGAPFDAALTADGRVRQAGISKVGIEAARALAMLLPAIFERSLTGVMLGAGASYGLRVAFGWALVFQEGRPALSWDLLRRQIAYALPFATAIALAIPQQSFHQYAVGAQVSAAAFAIYSVGCFQLPVVEILYTPMSELLQIGIAESERNGVGHRAVLLFRETVGQLALAFVPIAAFLFAIAPEFITLVFGKEYAAAAPILRVGILAVPLAALPLEGVLRARAQTRWFFAIYATKLAITVPLVLGLLQALGAIGAMMGYVATELFAKALMLRRAAQVFSVPVRDTLPLRQLREYALWALAAALPAGACASFLPVGVLGKLCAAGFLFVAIDAGGLYATGHLAMLDPLVDALLRPARVRPERLRCQSGTPL